MAETTDWRVGSKLVHPFDPELGVGIVRALRGRYMDVYFPGPEREITMAVEAGLRRLVLAPGETASLIESGDAVEVAAALDHRYRLADGRVVDDAALWPLARGDVAIERLATLSVDPVSAFQNRIAGLRLATLREAGGLGSFLGGRVELFAHQLHTALQAVEREPVRWLLADEVGLGKTIEACLILSALLRTGRASRALVVTPETLTVQWLTELYGKFHQVFTHLDPTRLEFTRLEFGDDFNPFVAHRNSVIAMEALAASPALQAHARDCEADLIVVDEAHRLAGAGLGAALAPALRRARHALLLTATPLQSDRRGFYRLLDLLHPDVFPSYAAFERAVDAGEAVLPCTSAVRRLDLGGLPGRVPVAVDLAAAADRVSDDPRARWIAERAPGWRAKGEKALVFAREIATAEALAAYLARKGEPGATVFHPELAADERDIALARFRETGEPVLLCSEAGGEGRNFQFCERMLHYDLPADPIALEQRIGRLDRIGRTRPVEIVYFRCDGDRPDLARLYERLELFARPSAGLDAALGGVREAVERAVARGTGVDIERLARRVARARRGAERATPRVFYPDAYDASRAQAVLGRVPPDLEERTREFCLGAAEDLGIDVVEKGGRGRYYFELGGRMQVSGLPGVRLTRYYGTFDREEALGFEALEFFSNGQELVEGLVAEFEDGERGRAALLELSGTGLRGDALLCVYKEGPQWSAAVIDARGALHSDWVEPVLAAVPRARALALDPDPDWAERIHLLARLAAETRPQARLNAVAYLRLG